MWYNQISCEFDNTKQNFGTACDAITTKSYCKHSKALHHFQSIKWYQSPEIEAEKSIKLYNLSKQQDPTTKWRHDPIISIMQAIFKTSSQLLFVMRLCADSKSYECPTNLFKSSKSN